MNLKALLETDILRRVTKPSRYLGTELNSVHKDLSSVNVRLALAFPDLYDIGLGNLGLHILYAILNKIPDVWAERVYSPALDMEAELRSRGLPVFGLESKDGITHFDGIGFTLQSELTYTNILNILDISSIPLRTKDRDDSHPLTFCGGPAVFNPEPLVPFMDFFVIGDGEDIVVEMISVFREHTSRADRLSALAKIKGIYVPALYPIDILSDGQILPSKDAPKITKRIARDLNSAAFPVEYIVPYTRQVHDRISLEVLRGCTQGCRFCQAGMTTRPVRERTIDNITTLLDRTLESTGYEEVSLVSLSTCDYSEVRSMVQEVVKRATPEHIGVSLPSLRLDSFSVELADMVAGIRRTGLTFAPEAASPRLRAVINKWIPDEELLQMSEQAYKLGWDHVKLYFMIGLPTERDEDVEAIADLTLRTLNEGRKFNRKAKVNTGVSTFVPKPFTPFQWAAQITPNEARRKQEILFQKIGRNRAIKFGRHPADETFLEGLVSRADRRAGDLIEQAFFNGAKFDAWDEHRNLEAWNTAISDINYDVEFQFRERSLDERLPWDHIDILIPKQWFVEDWERATELKHAQDCRHSKCHRCGVIDEERDLCAHMLRNSIEGRKSERSFVRADNPYIESPSRPGEPPKRVNEPDPAQRLLFRVAMTEGTRFLSQLETTNAWIRTLRRARIPLAYTKGFHPHPKIAFESARPVAEESYGTYMDVLVNEVIDPDVALERIRNTLPEHFMALSVAEIPMKSPSLMSSVEGMEYIIHIPRSSSELEKAIAATLGEQELLVKRKAKQKHRRKRGKPSFKLVDVRQNIKKISVGIPQQYASVITPRQEHTAIYADLVRVDGRGIRPSELCALLGTAIEECYVVRMRTRFADSTTNLGTAPVAKSQAEHHAPSQ